MKYCVMEVRDCFVVTLLAMTEIGCVFFIKCRAMELRDCFVVALLAMTVEGWFLYETLCDGDGRLVVVLLALTRVVVVECHCEPKAWQSLLS